MCIGIPLQVLALSPGHALCDDAGTPRQVRTTLLGDGITPGDWLLVFLDNAIERLSPARAAEIRHTLALLAGAMAGRQLDSSGDAGFDLPSRWTTAQLHALSGQPVSASTPEAP
ncbi:HypC/HybG/HupF family hydrogenase formation chaperone [Pseudaquabacterium pictum]|uniref:Hydrogenase n=1 Tax=Pseudaquabacterium pictum TaxID=2315236 RepID=A0A480ALF1_9BURK|nr:HypC/HybG/HupF family hydrogenase formation chaperone [Rubrivivax pictus]GCL62539.1 hypothetical protein AQPW35_16200 [Rubrivivax pictus]